MSNPKRRRELRETEKDIEVLLDVYWRLPSDVLRQELNALIEAAVELEREEFKRRLQLFSNRLDAAKASLRHVYSPFTG